MRNMTAALREASGSQDFAKRYCAYVASLLGRLDTAAIAAFIAALEAARAGQQTVFIAGNGGSASTASHMATDLGVGTLGADPSLPLRTLALTDNTATMTATANDHGYHQTFVAQLQLHYRPGDLLIVISASGNSANVVQAAAWVKERGGQVLGLLGFDGGTAQRLCDVVVRVETPRGEYGPVEDIHLMLNHLMTVWLKRRAQAAL